jgi:flagellar basal-body rod protein FlgF
LDKLIYTAMTGASHTLQQQAAVAQNLANSNTPGFRAAINTFRSVPLVGEGLATRSFVVDATAGADFTEGVLEPTGRALDVAVNGAGWLAVQTASGQEAYTRNGSLQVSQGGLLQTRNGLNVQGESGPITLPPDTHVVVAQDGTISTVPLENQPASAVVVGRLKLTNPPQKMMVRGDDGLFRSKDGKPAEADQNVNLVSGFLESSNVNAVEAMVNMISLARQFETQMKILTTTDNDARQAAKILSVN